MLLACITLYILSFFEDFPTKKLYVARIFAEHVIHDLLFIASIEIDLFINERFYLKTKDSLWNLCF